MIPQLLEFSLVPALCYARITIKNNNVKNPYGTGGGMRDHDRDVSTMGSSCPMPLVKVTNEVNQMQPGQVLKVIGDDPLFEEGLRDFCVARNLKLIDVMYEDDRTTAWIET
jgi:TusA-related sulfurtransferase